MEKGKYGHGIAAWTAAVFIRDNPACTYRQIEQVLDQQVFTANWRIMFTPKDRNSRKGSMGSTAMGLFWTRELGPSEDGSKRRVYRFTITPQGEEFASGPRPPTHQEMREAHAKRMLTAPDPNDWVQHAQAGDLLVTRESKRIWYPISASITHVSVHITDEDGKTRFNSASHYGCERGEMFTFVGLTPWKRGVDVYSFDHERQRQVYTGRVQALSSRTGQLVDVRAEYLKPITRRRK